MTEPAEKHPFTVVVAVNAENGGTLTQVVPPDDAETWARRLIDAADPDAPLTWSTVTVQAYDQRHAATLAVKAARGEES